jgi:16S rRNA (adenine1518-N6/adenine1519-N6)-dimethyltransferase
VRFIDSGHFSPKPKVNSATIMFEPLPKPVCTDKSFFELVRAAFSQKRKTFANSLSSLYPKEKITEILKKLNIKENARAEELFLNNFVDIYYFLKT